MTEPQRDRNGDGRLLIREPESRLRRGERAVAELEIDRALRENAHLAGVEVTGIGEHRSRPIAPVWGRARPEMERGDATMAPPRARPAEQAAAQGQLGILGSDRGQVLAFTRVEDKLQAFQGDMAAEKVEDGGGRLAPRTRLARAGGRAEARRRP